MLSRGDEATGSTLQSLVLDLSAMGLNQAPKRANQVRPTGMDWGPLPPLPTIEARAMLARGKCAEMAAHCERGMMGGGNVADKVCGGVYVREMAGWRMWPFGFRNLKLDCPTRFIAGQQNGALGCRR